MMKKFFLIFILLMMSFNTTFAIRALSENDYENFRKSLHLNEWQRLKIQKIEDDTKKEQQVYYNQLKSNDISNDKRKELEQKVYELNLKKDEEILKVLNIKQQFMYKEFNSRVY